MQNQNLDYYQTRDLYFASYLLAAGFNFTDLIFDEQERFFWFQFENKSLCEETDRKFQLNKLIIKAKDMAEAIKFLKRKINQ